MDIYSLDIGGSSIKHGVVRVERVQYEIIERMPTIALNTSLFLEVRKHIVSEIKAHAHRAGQSIDVAICTTGGVSRSGLVWNAGHFIDYVNIDWQQILQAELPGLVRKVVTVNDGKASAWAEYYRLGRGTEVFVHFVVGSGVGGGIICFDQLLFGDEESAGALGHMKVGGESEIVCSCGHTGCVETLASGKAIARLFGELNRDADIQNDTPTFAEAFDAARTGNQQALRAFELAGKWLGVAISNVINVLNPRYITVGGGVMLASIALSTENGGPYMASAIRSAHELAFTDVAEETIIRPASAGNDGGLIGAALLCASTVSPES